MNPFSSIQDKVTIITGASSGIGAETAVYFSKLGAKLVLTGRNKVNLEATSRKCVGHTPIVVVADLTKDDDVKKIVSQTIAAFGQIDILVNNAGILVIGNIETSTMEDYDKVMATNLRSVFLLTSLAVPHLIKSRGAVVNVSSLAGLRNLQGVLSYGMSKAALDHFTRGVAADLSAKQVRVNSVNPALIDTPIFLTSGMTESQVKDHHDRCLDLQLRPGNTEDVAKAIAFLASDAAGFITGACLPVDHGRSVLCPH